MNFSDRPIFLYVKGEDELARLAEESFGKPIGELKRIDYPSASEAMRSAVVCTQEMWPDFFNMDAAFYLHYEDDGVYLEILPKQGKGLDLDVPCLNESIARKKIKDVDAATLKMLYNIGYGYLKIAPAQQEVRMGEDVRIVVAQDKMMAAMTILRPEEGGEPATIDMVKAALAECGVEWGIDWEAVENCLREKNYDKNTVIAKGKPATNGEDGKLTIHFNTEHNGMAYEDPETGVVDYRRLDLIERVKAGQILATRTFATPGEAGCNVCGKPITPKYGKECRMPKGKGVKLNEDFTEMIAAISGKVVYANDLIQVDAIYEIRGDVDFSTGSIDFDGDVVVRGNVISQMTVKATTGVKVYGGVQDATIIAGGDVVIMGGLLGQGKGSVETNGSLTAKFIEQGRVRAGGDIRADQMFYSDIESGSSVIASGKRGCIVGGSVSALHVVAAKTIGAVNHPKTRIKVGIDPQLTSRSRRLETDIESGKKQIEELQKVYNYLVAKTENGDDVAEKLRQVFTTKVQFIQNVKIMQKEYEEIKDEVKSMDSGSINVSDSIYPGVTLFISDESYAVSGTEIRHATFKLMGDKIDFYPYDFVDRSR